MAAGELPTPGVGTTDGASAVAGDAPSRKREILMFIVLAVLIWPFIAIGFVASWGFVVWMYQLVTGPPGPPL